MPRAFIGSVREEVGGLETRNPGLVLEAQTAQSIAKLCWLSPLGGSPVELGRVRRVLIVPIKGKTDLPTRTLNRARGRVQAFDEHDCPRASRRAGRDELPRVWVVGGTGEVLPLAQAQPAKRRDVDDPPDRRQVRRRDRANETEQILSRLIVASTGVGPNAVSAGVPREEAVAVKQDAPRSPRPFFRKLPPRLGGADEPDENAVCRDVVNAALVAVCFQLRHLLMCSSNCWPVAHGQHKALVRRVRRGERRGNYSIRFGAEAGTRTPTPLRALDPETGAGDEPALSFSA